MVPIKKRHATLERETKDDYGFTVTVENRDAPYTGVLYLEDDELEDLYFVLHQYFKLYTDKKEPKIPM